jgi:hypothetical protein
MSDDNNTTPEVVVDQPKSEKSSKKVSSEKKVRKDGTFSQAVSESEREILFSSFF